ncbi:hypothetical protein H257_03352 [Aphanomyces astaci]|uniref:Uncharacterized protein n=1 Tax=Aphanomyces astaci TaxID=112090 RepID=W4GYH9_APHAT|nr:hypothetical protein H257_03352 [Aphanomyces astaci]ETV83988.1 hypothetical protein H257_03352 [Aphanomyces astaci]|eukprot:XP_009825680.1 hypothetical protein H257_03352 [Aphanomyces astaci]
MSTNSDFTIEGARRSRISDSTRLGYLSGIKKVVNWAVMTGKPELLMPSTEHEGRMTLDLHAFANENFLEFIVWTVRERDIGLGILRGYRSAVKSLYIDQGVALPEPYDGDMKFSVFEHLCAASMGLPDCGFMHL